MIDIYIPTLNRPNNIYRVVENVNQATNGDFMLYFIIEALDVLSKNVLDSITDSRVTYLINENPGTYAGCINYAYKNTSGEYFFLGADDLLFYPDWDTIALEKMKDNICVVGTNDLHNPEVLLGEAATHSLVKRSYIEEVGGTADRSYPVLFNYAHNYVDTEFIQTAISRGVFKMAFDSKVEHLHWAWGFTGRDSTYEKGYQANAQDKRIYEQREHLWKQ